MMREAEAHAEEDRRRKEEVEIRNQADQAVYAAEKLLKEMGDKVSAGDKQAVESAMSDVAKVVDAPEEKLKKLEQTIIGLSRVIPMTAVDLAKIAEAGGQMGIGADQIEEFVTAVSKISTAFKMTSADAGEMAGKLMNVWHMNVGGITQLADVINVLGNNTNATEARITEVMTRVGAMPKMFGLAANETAALAAAVLSLGKPPMVAATGINALLSKLQTASAQTPEFRNALASIGISA
jgi:TP901 family phage tail tape measure protein